MDAQLQPLLQSKGHALVEVRVPGYVIAPSPGVHQTFGFVLHLLQFPVGGSFSYSYSTIRHSLEGSAGE